MCLSYSACLSMDDRAGDWFLVNHVMASFARSLVSYGTASVENACFVCETSLEAIEAAFAKTKLTGYKAEGLS